MDKESKKERKMTEKGFVFKCGTKAANSAAAFIAAHRDFLLTGTLKSVTEPILNKMDEGNILPTPALEELKNAVFTHMIIREGEAIENSIGKTREYSSNKNHIATIYDKDNNVLTFVNSKGETKDLVKSFNLPQEAERWADLRLVEQAAGSYAIVIHSNTNQQSVISRETSYMQQGSLSRIFKQKKTALHKIISKGSGSLKPKMKCKHDHASFSRG